MHVLLLLYISKEKSRTLTVAYTCYVLHMFAWKDPEWHKNVLEATILFIHTGKEMDPCNFSPEDRLVSSCQSLLAPISSLTPGPAAQQKLSVSFAAEWNDVEHRGSTTRVYWPHVRRFQVPEHLSKWLPLIPPTSCNNPAFGLYFEAVYSSYIFPWWILLLEYGPFIALSGGYEDFLNI